MHVGRPPPRKGTTSAGRLPPTRLILSRLSAFQLLIQPGEKKRQRGTTNENQLAGCICRSGTAHRDQNPISRKPSNPDAKLRWPGSGPIVGGSLIRRQHRLYILRLVEILRDADQLIVGVPEAQNVAEVVVISIVDLVEP